MAARERQDGDGFKAEFGVEGDAPSPSRKIRRFEDEEAEGLPDFEELDDQGADDWYRRPHWYDILHQADSVMEVDALELIDVLLTQRMPAKNRVWLEPACGSGRLLRVAAGRGQKVVGVDIVPEMVEYAERSLRSRKFGEDRARVLLGDMRKFKSPWKADLALCTINSIRHLMDDASMIAHLNCVAAALKVGGMYVVGIGLDDGEWDEPVEDIWRGQRGTIAITQAVQYLPPDRTLPGPSARHEQVHTHLIVTTPNRVQHLDSSYVLRTWTVEQWRAIIEKSDLMVQAVCDAHGQDMGGSLESQIKYVMGETGYGHWVLRRRGDAVWKRRENRRR